jgi:hypothetical protein
VEVAHSDAVKSTVRPDESVRRPSSRSCRNRSNSLGGLFFDFVEQHQAVGLAGNGAVSWPPSS